MNTTTPDTKSDEVLPVINPQPCEFGASEFGDKEYTNPGLTPATATQEFPS